MGAREGCLRCGYEDVEGAGVAIVVSLVLNTGGNTSLPVCPYQPSNNMVYRRPVQRNPTILSANETIASSSP